MVGDGHRKRMMEAQRKGAGEVLPSCKPILMTMASVHSLGYFLKVPVLNIVKTVTKFHHEFWKRQTFKL